MTLFMICGSTISFIIFAISAFSRLPKDFFAAAQVVEVGENYFTAEQIEQIKNTRRKFLLIAILNVVLTYLNYFAWKEYWDEFWVVVISMGAPLSYFYEVFRFILIPSKSSYDYAEKIKVQAQKRAEEQSAYYSKYRITKVLNAPSMDVGFSDHTKMLCCFECTETNFTPLFQTPYETIIGCEMLEDNSTIMQGGVSRAVVGGIIAGEVGAIIGAGTRKTKNVVEKLSVRVLTNVIDNPVFNIPIIENEIQRHSSEYEEKYKIAETIFATINAVYSMGNDEKKKRSPEIENEVAAKNNFLNDTGTIMQREEEKNGEDNLIEELEILFKMREKGLITQEEYTAKKKQLLGI